MNELKTVEARELRDYVLRLIDEEEQRKLNDVNQDTDFQKMIGLIRTWECVLDEGGRFKNPPMSAHDNIPPGYDSEGNPVLGFPLGSRNPLRGEHEE